MTYKVFQKCRNKYLYSKHTKIASIETYKGKIYTNWDHLEFNNNNIILHIIQPGLWFGNKRLVIRYTLSYNIIKNIKIVPKHYKL